MSSYILVRDRPDAEPEDPPATSTPLVPAIFTDLRMAKEYLRDLDKGFNVARLSAMQLLRWIIWVQEEGVHYLDVNPTPGGGSEGDSHGRLAIERHLAHFAELLTRDIVACAEAAKRDRTVSK